ncbi:glycosyltransferase family 4 protein [Pseudomonas sp. CFBP 8770]|uniref:MraY family glycosyltransferase n=1 Tax=unclassified Pseudomonas TaxID=196821 RepID=UPI00177E31F0|nr:MULTISPECIES: glycosyltransferase family 4 protein [unclassified Pseudomonas]MBD8472747.1 glycosyltransferase family 4 protein [Pseudomonas sp. CFBP 8773]MBD8646151.1 glycosyltransferase family 4 protein [Pseudomonas sp. CFBP 8770]
MSLLVWLLVVLVLAYGLTFALRRYALARSLMDVPNARSSHTVPTPRGGGVAIVLVFLAAISGLALWGMLESHVWLALFGSGALVAVVGFLDDHNHIAARWRLLGHFAAAAWALLCLGGMPGVVGAVDGLAALWWVFGLLYLVWMLNLYNFMDGIDGIASVEAICVCAGACLIYALGGHAQLMWLPAVLAAAVSGFLLWNWPPAKIFMGDAGSGFLGLVLAVLSVQAAWVKPAYFWGWVILLGVFIVDATFTLLRRLLRGDKVYQAHRSHAYQYASRVYGRHLPVTVATALITLGWLLPWAIAVTVFGLNPVLGTFIAYIPLLWLAFRYHAGELERA